MANYNALIEVAAWVSQKVEAEERERRGMRNLRLININDATSAFR